MGAPEPRSIAGAQMTSPCAQRIAHSISDTVKSRLFRVCAAACACSVLNVLVTVFDGPHGASTLSEHRIGFPSTLWKVSSDYSNVEYFDPVAVVIDLSFAVAQVVLVLLVYDGVGRISGRRCVGNASA